MLRTFLSSGLAIAAAWTLMVWTASAAVAQVPVVTYYPPQPVVGYVPEVRGLFGQRLVYRPVVAAPAPVVLPAAPPVAVITAPAAPVTTYYPPAAPVASYAAPVTTYYAPAAPVVSYPGRVTTYYAPARIVTPRVITAYPPWVVP